MAARPGIGFEPITNRLAKVRFGAGLVGLAAVSALVWLTVWVAIVPPVFGWAPVSVMSGSMEPVIDTGDIVVVAPPDGEQLAIGTVIVFDGGEATGSVTHRIVDVTPTGEYLTHGDANGQMDSTPVSPADVTGAVAC